MKKIEFLEKKELFISFIQFLILTLCSSIFLNLIEHVIKKIIIIL